jgi:hypothetical protein
MEITAIIGNITKAGEEWGSLDRKKMSLSLDS